VTETCTIVVTMRDKLDNYREEDIVKEMWPYVTPWFTRRRGIDKGKIILSDGAVEIDWEYRSTYTDDPATMD
jgi:hypothetical protein